MALTYAESFALMNDTDFRGRIQVAALKFADYIFNEGNTVPAHNTRLRWATTCEQQPGMTAAGLQPPVVMDSEVQAVGAEITDVALQSSVETVVNKLL